MSNRYITNITIKCILCLICVNISFSIHFVTIVIIVTNFILCFSIFNDSYVFVFLNYPKWPCSDFIKYSKFCCICKCESLQNKFDKCWIKFTFAKERLIYIKKIQFRNTPTNKQTKKRIQYHIYSSFSSGFLIYFLFQLKFSFRKIRSKFLFKSEHLVWANLTFSY